MTDSPLIVLVAGEASGDNLGAQLITALRQRIPQARFAGIAGSRMAAAGCEVWDRVENLSVMGLFEIIPHLPRLLRIRRNLIDRVLAERPAVYVGVDAKEFNLRIAPRFKEAGIPTVQYVSPQVWAWRQGRVQTIGRAVDLVLCLLPFEKQFYDAHSVQAEFVGHPLADHVPMQMSAETARYQLGIPREGSVRRDPAGQPAGRGVAPQSGLRGHHGVAGPGAAATALHRGAGERLDPGNLRSRARAVLGADARMLESR